MNFSKNYTVQIFCKRILCYIIYFIVSAFTGKIIITVLYPFMQYIINNNNERIFDMAWYIIHLLAMCAVMMFFISRDGFSDIDQKCYAPMKNLLASLSAALLFFEMLSFFYFFPQFINYSYIVSLYFSYEAVQYFIPNFAFFNIIPPFFVYTSAILLLSVILTSVGYSLGRKRWIKYKEKKIERMKATRV